MQTYDRSFYRKGSETALRSARCIVPLAMKLIAPQSLVDIGCGTGEWLSIFQSMGVADILGLDGGWVPVEELHIPRVSFRVHEIGNAPLKLGRQFDLAVSLEVGEHLKAEVAQRYIAELTAAAPVVLFSAAIPYQGGVEHINEQWPGYWTRLFNQRGFVCIDCIRREVWTNTEVAYWYAQNCFVAVRKTALPAFPNLAAARQRFGEGVLPWVHPAAYYVKVQQLQRKIAR
jgi:SAM-dependent methyltransferase